MGLQVVWNAKSSLYMAIVHHLYQSSQSQNTKNGRSGVTEFVHGQQEILIVFIIYIILTLVLGRSELLVTKPAAMD